jgi:hypothetical protein
MARDIVVDKFTPSIKFAKDKEGNLKPYPPTQGITLKKNFTTGNFDAELYDKNKEIIDETPVDVLKRGCEITPILECTGVWITEKGFGLTWKLFQARVDVAAEGSQRGCAIQDDEDSAPVVTKPAAKPKAVIADDEEEDLMAAVKPVAKAAPAPAAASAASAAQEPDVDEDEVHEAPAVPVAKKVIKKVIKKAA